MAAEKLTLNRIEELRDGSVIKKDEWDELFALAKKQLEGNVERLTELVELRAALGVRMENLRQCAAKLADSDRLRKLTAMDLGASETHCQSLIRRLQETVAREHTAHDRHDAFLREVHNCIDRKPLSPVAQLNSTLLRLQEALESTIHEAPPAK